MDSLRKLRLLAWLAAICGLASTGCALFPDRIVEPQFHNPFPQLHRVAVLPFYNQSAEPTVDGDQIALAYYNELQLIPGFEVMPVGVAKQMLAASITATGNEPRSGPDFQRLAEQMGVDAVIVGSITEYSPYYPPRLGLAVDWYAANPGYHPIPAGYGLPWGRAEEEFIPNALVREAEFALAREQLKTQTPDLPPRDAAGDKPPSRVQPASARAALGDSSQTAETSRLSPPVPPADVTAGKLGDVTAGRPGDVTAGKLGDVAAMAAPQLPADWPDPRGFIPLPPSLLRPTLRPQHAPLITHTRMFNGHDAQFTERLATFFYLRDDARFGGWPAYLERPEDFVRFCCYLHLTETLAARGGAGDTRVLWRWPIGRYER